MAVSIRYVVQQVKSLLNVQLDAYYSEDRILMALDYVKDQLVESVKGLGRRFFVADSEFQLDPPADRFDLPVEWTGTILLGVRDVGTGREAMKILSEWDVASSEFWKRRGGYGRINRQIVFSGGGFDRSILVYHVYEKTPPRFTLDSPPDPDETNVTDDLLYPHWALIPGAVAVLVADDRYSVIYQKAEADWSEAKQRVIQNVITANERGVGSIEPYVARFW